MRFTRWPLAAAFSLALFGLAACAEDPQPMQVAAPPPPPSLYQRLGEKPGIVAVVDDFVGNVAADKRINRFFKKSKLPHLKMQLVDQLCEGTGGPCKYTGPSMKEAHKGRGVTDAAFAALVEDLQKSLNKFKVPAQEQNDLLAILGPMKGDIVAQNKAKPMAKAVAKPAAMPVVAKAAPKK
jgi:hemoglobin